MNVLTGLQVVTTDTRATMVSQIPFSHPRALKPLTTEGTLNTEESWRYTQAQGNLCQKTHRKALHVASFATEFVHPAFQCE